MDVVVGTRDRSNQASITVFLNQTAAVGNFLRVHFKMPAPNPFAVGSALNASSADESRTLLMEKAHWDGSPIHVGLGDATECRLNVRFPDGKALNSDSIRATTTVIADHTRGFLERPAGSGRD